MSDLSMFYAENVATDITEDFVVSDRFKEPLLDEETGEQVIDEVTGKVVMVPVKWKLRGMSEEENEEIRKSATKPVKGKHGQRTLETDPAAYMARLAVASVVFPNLKDAALQSSYGVKGADNLLRKMLLSGEYAALVEKVQEVNGFDKSMPDLIEEVKN